MRRTKIRSLAVALGVTTAVTGLGATALGSPTPTTDHAVSSTGTSDAAVAEAARTAAMAHAAATGLTKGEVLRAQDVMLDPEGSRHVRFALTHQGMPVLGGDLVVHLDHALAYTGVTRAAGPEVKPTTKAKLTPTQ